MAQEILIALKDVSDYTDKDYGAIMKLFRSNHPLKPNPVPVYLKDCKRQIYMYRLDEIKRFLYSLERHRFDNEMAQRFIFR